MFRTLKIVLVSCLLASCATMDSEQATTVTPNVADSQQASMPASKPFVDASAALSTSAAALAGGEQRADPTVERGDACHHGGYPAARLCR